MRTNGVISSKQLSVRYYQNPHLQFRKANKEVYYFVMRSNWLFSCGPPAGRSIIFYFAYIHVNVHTHEQERQAMVCITHRISYVPLAFSLGKCVPMVSSVLSSYIDQSDTITIHTYNSERQTKMYITLSCGATGCFHVVHQLCVR